MGATVFWRDFGHFSQSFRVGGVCGSAAIRIARTRSGEKSLSLRNSSTRGWS
jgi:hypothetical protein